MSENQSNAAGVQGQYAAQVAADLEANRKEQERIGAEVAALTEQLQVLENDHSLLVNMQQALGANGTESASAGAAKKETSRAKAAPKSQQRAKKASAAPRKKKSAAAAPSAKAAGKSTTATAKSTGAKATPKVPAARKGEPTLGELIREHLVKQSEPRSSAEIASALTEAHPDRTIKTTVVRTTVEKLVAKSQVQRTRQGSSVFYSATAPSEKSAPSQPEAAAS
ncbi:BlaI/MecI/CopY family transcriptional regulator [Streptomyces flavofungini]|uniref:BlaI/MecI/CopY family transcriptional regulator n=1 Tax=Streptomyces flavofungini TaxID=68200 RepID=UPI0034DFBC01